MRACRFLEEVVHAYRHSAPADFYLGPRVGEAGSRRRTRSRTWRKWARTRAPARWPKRAVI